MRRGGSGRGGGRGSGRRRRHGGEGALETLSQLVQRALRVCVRRHGQHLERAHRVTPQPCRLGDGGGGRLGGSEQVGARQTHRQREHVTERRDQR